VTKMTSEYEIGILRPSDPLEEWDHFVDESPQGCIFCRSWWLEAVCPQGFEVLVLRKGGRIVAGMPLVTLRKWGYTYVCMPQLTQTLGPLLVPSNRQTYEGRLSHEMGLLESLVEAIPDFAYFSVRFHSSLTNWLPFYWAGYEQTTLYSYILTGLTNLDQVFSDFAHMKRKNIKKAEKLVEVREDLSAEDFYANHAMTLHKQGLSILYRYELFKSIYDAAHRNHAGKTWYAVDDQQNIHAAIFVVFDRKSAYYLISSIDPDYRSSGAATLLLRDAIAHVSQYTKRFDFEGSMIRGVEGSFRRFGAVQTPYFQLTKANSLLLKMGLDVRSWLRR
jgi:GNAT superfamily N-acetyltransferase